MKNKKHPYLADHEYVYELDNELNINDLDAFPTIKFEQIHIKDHNKDGYYLLER